MPAATLQKMREPPQPATDKVAASYDRAVVKVYREELDKVHATVP